MNLAGVHRLVHPDACFVCKWARMPMVLFPLAGYQNLVVEVYAKVPDGTPVRELQGFRSGRRKITVCTAHYDSLQADYVEIMAEEMAFDKAWNDYIDRVER